MQVTLTLAQAVAHGKHLKRSIARKLVHYARSQLAREQVAR